MANRVAPCCGVAVVVGLVAGIVPGLGGTAAAAGRLSLRQKFLSCRIRSTSFEPPSLVPWETKRRKKVWYEKEKKQDDTELYMRKEKMRQICRESG